MYHFQEIRTPVFEHSELFHRGVGETSDIVHKETYTFNDRSDRSITLRPEGTAGTVRAAIEHGLIAQEGSRAKVYYFGPNFRYERPASGRLREHHQFGVETFGIAEPEADVECILLQMEFYRRCGVKDLELQINSLGDADSKQRYRNRLVEFLTPRKDQLSEDSQQRLVENPLRILDSKDPRDQQACQGTPLPSNRYRRRAVSISRACRSCWQPATCNWQLPSASTPSSSADSTITRRPCGRSPPAGWAQNAIGGGGRYDNLVENLGGRPTPGVGFGSGLERLLIALESQGVALPRSTKPLFWLVAIGETAKAAQWQLLRELRAAGVVADMDFSGRSPKAQFKIADREKASFCIIAGDSELAAQTVVLKDLGKGEQRTIARAQVIGVAQQLAHS